MNDVLNKTKRINSIQALRGIACIFVILTHIEFIGIGAFAVDIFLCISGFIMMYSTQKKDNPNFLLKRLVRIIPLYYLLTFITTIAMLLVPSMFQEVTFQFQYLIKSLLFIPFDITGQYAIQPLLRIGWTVNYEIFFYLIFAVSLKISHKYRGLISTLIILILVIIHPSIPLSNIPMYYYSQPILLEFVFGILIYYIYQYLTTKKELLIRYKSISYISLIIIISIFIYLCVIGTTKDINEYHRITTWGIPCSLIVFLSLLLEFYYDIPKQLTQLGNISYSVYLVHYYPIQFIGRKIFDYSTCTPLSIIGACIGIIISLLLGYLCWKYIEKNKKLNSFIHTYL